VLVCVALIATILGAQALAAFSAPGGGTTSTGALLGRAGFEYLGGLRKFVAATLWNRLEPQFHLYGEGETIDKRLEFLPSMRLVQMLDPQFEQSYYVSSFMLARIGRVPQAMDVAREGIANNPSSGLMRSNYVQILLLADPVKNLPEAHAQAKAGISPGITWANDDDQFEGYGTFRTVFRLAGDMANAEKMTVEQKRLKARGAAIGVERE
jgi:hypothetical protein